MVHSIRGQMRGWQVNCVILDTTMRAILERNCGKVPSQRGAMSNKCTLPYLYSHCIQVSKTYAVRAVVDRRQNKTVTFHDAVQRGIIDRESGAFLDTLTNEKVSMQTLPGSNDARVTI